MPSRSHNRDHCPVCEIFRPLCVCEIIREVKPLTSLFTSRVMILMHVREITLPTNTARLAAAVLPSCEIRLRGLKDQPMDTRGLVEPDRQSLFLFPSEDAVELTPEFVSGLGKPVVLIVPDGNWRQARKTAGRVPELGAIPRVKLPPGPPSNYRLRKEPNLESVSTYEAIARALGVIEGTELGPPAQAGMERVFDIRVERAMWAKGKHRAEDCKYPIPPEAFDAFRLAGLEGGRKAKELLAAAAAGGAEAALGDDEDGE